MFCKLIFCFISTVLSISHVRISTVGLQKLQLKTLSILELFGASLMHYYVSLHPSGHRACWLQIQYRQSESDVASQLPVGLRWNPSSCFTAVACQPFCFTSLLNKESKPLAFSLSLLQSCLRTACTLKKESRLTSVLSLESENVVVSCSLLIQLLPWDEAQCMCVSERTRELDWQLPERVWSVYYLDLTEISALQQLNEYYWHSLAKSIHSAFQTWMTDFL